MEVSNLVKYLSELEKTSLRLEIRQILLKLLRQLEKEQSDEDIYIAVYLLTGILTPAFIPLEFGIQEKTIINIILSTFNIQKEELLEIFGKFGDWGDVWEHLIMQKQYSLKNNNKKDFINTEKSLLTLYNQLLDIALISGKGAILNKTAKLQALLLSLKATEAKYIIRFVLGKLRLGLNVKSILDALAYFVVFKTSNFNKGAEKHEDLGVNISEVKQIKKQLEYFFGISNDIGYVTYTVLHDVEHSLADVSGMPGIPIASQLAERQAQLSDVFKRMVNPRVEPKYDGLRGQVHIFVANNNSFDLLKQRVWYKAYVKVLKQEHANLGLFDSQRQYDYMIFSRNASNLSQMFPEVEHDVNIILQYLNNDKTKKELLNFIKNVTVRKNLAKYNVLFKEDLSEKQLKELAKTAVVYSFEEFKDIIARFLNKIANKKYQSSVIFDSEIVGYDEKKDEFISFQQTISRRRKYNVKEASKAVPIRFFVFDVLFLGYDVIELPLVVRRALLEFIFLKLQNKLKYFVLTPQHIVKQHDNKTLNSIFSQYVDTGLEGIMLKCPLDAYRPGIRSYSWVKYKRAMEGGLADTIDVVVLGYYKGKGKRADLGIGALLIGVYDKKNNKFVSVSKLGTGVTDDKWRELKQLLDNFKVVDKPVLYDVKKDLFPDVWCNPHVVLEVEADEITKSPLHTAKYALRFPRFKRLRPNKSAEQATTVEELQEMYKLSYNK